MRFASQISMVALVSMAAMPAYAEGVPQLDTTWFASQLFWLALCFAATLVVVTRMVVPSVGGVLATRASAIASAMQEAETFRNKAENASSGMDEATRNARATSAQLVQTAKDESAAQAATAGTALDSELKKKLDEAEKAITEAKNKATQDLNQHAGDVAQALVAKLVESKANSKLKAAS
jgi:F-type H+-transporting ATPase subunit b